MTYEEHVQWCLDRSDEHLQSDPEMAFRSFASDLNKLSGYVVDVNYYRDVNTIVNGGYVDTESRALHYMTEFMKRLKKETLDINQ